ncbi:SGNH/GDSL hydrolase family protein [uncultured Fibrella sp.]|uniref:SGNH/GDSL hydrolase family protein n=1 Tax=uncultured Fibrella sp. TaxID=1284596 RepID=UPI0035CA40F8
MKNTLFSLAILLTLLTVPTWAQQTPATLETDIAALEAQDKTTPPPANGIVFVGSSSIRLWNGLKEAFPGKPIIQRGFGGSTLGDVIKYMPRLILPFNPKQVVLYAGDNDIGQNNKTARDVYSQFLTFFMLMRKQLPNATITYVAVKPSPARKQFMPVTVEANNMIRQYLAGQKNTSFADVYTPMLGANGQPRPELFVADSLHMSPKGYEVWKSVIGPVLK